MEVIGGVASIIQLIEATARTIAVIRKLTASHKNARKEQAQAARRLFDLSGILGQILAFYKTTENDVDSLQPRVANARASIEDEDGTVAHCMAHVQTLTSILDQMAKEKRLVWVFKAEKVQRELDSIRLDMETLSSLLQNDMLSTILMATSRIDEMANSVNALASRSDTHEMFKWLNAPTSTANYRQARRKHQPGSGEWLIHSSLYRKWKDECQLTWINGISGCGKTVLASTVVAELQSDFQEKPDSAICYFFFDFQDTGKQHVSSLLRSLLAQLAGQSEDVIWSIRQLYKACSSGLEEPTIEQLLEAIWDAVNYFSGVFFVVDGLDESLATEQESLGNILEKMTQELESMHLMTFSQPIGHIRDRLTKAAHTKFSIKDVTVNQDIEAYVRERLQGSDIMESWSKERLTDIGKKLSESSNGMFRWVSLQLDELEKCENDREITTQLKSLPKGLPETYERILSRLNDKQRPKARHVLTCLALTPEIITLSQIHNSLQIEPDSPRRIESDLRPVPGVLQNSLAGLVAFENKYNSSKSDLGNNLEDSCELRLAHSSVKDYLLSTSIRDSCVREFSLDPPKGHLYMARLCVSCLLYHNNAPIEREALQENPFLAYAASNLALHAQAANECEARDGLDDLIYELFDSQSRAWKNWYRVCNPLAGRSVWDDKRTSKAHALHHAASWNLWRIVERLLDNGHEIEKGMFFGAFRPIHFAAENESFECLEILLRRGADINSPAWPKRKTPLHHISYHPMDRSAAAAWLIDHGADLYAGDDWIGTPLQQAAHEGRLGIVQTMLNKGANPNYRYKHDRIGSFRFELPLQCAAYWGLVGITEALLDSGADIHAASDHLGTALHAAAINGKAEAAEFLMARGADVAAHAGICGSVLDAAYYGASRKTIDVILSRLSRKEDDDTIARKVEELAEAKCFNLFEAARRGAVKKIITLLDKQGGKIDDRVLLTGETPIILAAKQGHLKTVEVLAQRGADLQSRDRRGKRALHVAARRNDVGMVKMLLEHGADMEIRDDGDKTALNDAEDEGHVEMAEFLRSYNEK